MPKTNNWEWTKPYYGISHLGDFNLQKRRVTVIDYKTFVQLHKWFPGCGFNPKEEEYKTVAAAKRAGEKWMKDA